MSEPTVLELVAETAHQVEKTIAEGQTAGHLRREAVALLLVVANPGDSINDALTYPIICAACVDQITNEGDELSGLAWYWAGECLEDDRDSWCSHRNLERGIMAVTIGLGAAECGIVSLFAVGDLVLRFEKAGISLPIPADCGAEASEQPPRRDIFGLHP